MNRNFFKDVVETQRLKGHGQKLRKYWHHVAGLESLNRDQETICDDAVSVAVETTLSWGCQDYEITSQDSGK